tara:strand:+ start:6349 stop:7245 length:897 start_codon:yes stop_codon:yes gene_type:complete
MTPEKKLKDLFFNTDGAIFMGANRIATNCEIGIFGVPYDGTTSFRPGSRFGPSAVREVSSSLETYCPQFNLDLNDINYVDLGSLEIPFGDPEPVIALVKKASTSILVNGMKPLMIGGEHSVSSGAVDATVQFYEDLVLIQLDAHADLREEWLGSKYNHACTMRRCLEKLPSKILFQLGIRSGTREEFQEMRSTNRLILDEKNQPARRLKEVLHPFIGKPIYLSIDLDWFDPSVLPGTGTPEPGGYFWDDFSAIIDVLKEHRIVATDIVELAPQLDPIGSSSILTAKVVRSILMLLNST